MFKLSKTVFRALREDSAELLEGFLHQVDPSDAQLLGAPLFIKCAQAQASHCLTFLLDHYPQHAQSFLTQTDLLGNTPLLVCSSWGSQALIQQLVSLNSEMAGRSNSNGHYPIERALRHANWEAAEILLEAAPQLAKDFKDSFGRVLLHSASEPGMDEFGPGFNPLWIPPPLTLIDRLLELGSDPLAQNKNGYYPFDSALANKSSDCALRLISAAAAALTPKTRAKKAELFNLTKSKELAALHWCARYDLSECAQKIIALGGKPDVQTTLGSSALGMAIRNGAFKTADILLKAGAQPPTLKPDRRSYDYEPPLSLCAMQFEDPPQALRYLAQNNLPLFEREILSGASSAEMAWEKLHFNEARQFWETLSAEEKKSGLDTLLGPIERCVRSEFEVEEKIRYLVATGLKPFSLKGIDRSLWDTPNPTHHFRQANRHNCMLSSYWQNCSESHLFILPPTADTKDPHDDLLGFMQSDSFRSNDGPRRPALLSYCIASKRYAQFQILVQLDQEFHFFANEDWLSCWREALRAKVPVILLTEIKSKLQQLALPWDAEGYQQLAIASLGTQNCKKIGFSYSSAGSEIEQLLKTDPAQSFSIFGHTSSRSIGQMLSQKNSTESTSSWDLFSKNKSPAFAKLSLAEGMPYPATACLHFLAACAAQADPELSINIILARMPLLAKQADSGSPWGKHPQQSLSLLLDQIAWEESRFRAAANLQQTPAQIKKTLLEPNGLYQKTLLSLMANSAARLFLSKIISQLPPAPQPDQFYEKFAENIDSATGFGKQVEAARGANRALYDALSLAPAWKEWTEQRFASVLAGRCSDPGIFDSIVSKINGSSNRLPLSAAFNRLASSRAAKLSPAHAERLARAADFQSTGEGSLDIATRLAQCGRMINAIDNTKTMQARVLRAFSIVPPETILLNSSHIDRSPFAQALMKGNFSCALALLELVETLCPAVYPIYQQQAAPLWLIGRSLELSNNLFSADLYEPNPDVSKQQNLLLLQKEYETLCTKGARFNIDSKQDSIAATALASQRNAYPFVWALREGLNPSHLFDTKTDLDAISSWCSPWDIQDKFKHGAQIPSCLLLVLSQFYYRQSPELIGSLVFEWHQKGLPLYALVATPDDAHPPAIVDQKIHIFEFLRADVLSDVEQRLLNDQLLVKQPLKNRSKAL